MNKCRRHQRIVNNLVSFLRRSHVWTKDRIVKSPFKEVDIPNITVSEYVWENIHKWTDKTAVICGITDRQYTYGQLYKQSQVLGANLRKNFNIRDGDTVAVMMPNVAEYPATVLGIFSAGGIVTTLNPVYTAYEVQRQLIMSEAKLIFTVPETVSVIQEAFKLSKTNVPIIVMDVENNRPGNTVSFKEILNNTNVDLGVLKEVKRRAEDVAVLPYSSGTTGLPKGVELTNKNIISNCVQQDTEGRMYDYTTESNQDSILGVLPMFHSYGLNVIMLHKLAVGLKLVTLPRFKPDTFIPAMDKHKFNVFYLAPPLLLFLASHPGVKPSHLDRLRCVTIGAAPSPKADIEAFQKKVKSDVHVGQAYGLTETSPVATIAPLGYKDYTSVGFALPNVELRIVDDELKNLGPNKVGELIIRGPNVMKGYKNNPEANKQVFLEDGWFRSGDLARINKEGAVTIADRLKELIKVKGYQVPPAELESVLKEHPDVFDAAVVPVPDPTTGQRPRAFVVLRDGKSTPDTDILEFVSKRVAPYKRIKDVMFLKEIPKNPSGKILRRLLVEKYCKN